MLTPGKGLRSDCLGSGQSFDQQDCTKTTAPSGILPYLDPEAATSDVWSASHGLL